MAETDDETRRSRSSNLNQDVSSADDAELVRATEQFQRRRRFEKRTKTAAELISRLIAKRGFAETQWNDRLQKAWLSVVDIELADKTRATVIKRGSLEIIASSSAAMQQLAFVKQSLLQKLQQELPDAGIRALRFRTGPIE